jgi:phospholipid/cholesterol/gamma-HCH transport system substrate-binding protein
MEFKARYELIGAFTLLVIAMVFGFVYWLNNAGAHGEQAVFRVRFDTPVSGLLVGGSVFFNGIRVGEVRSLDLDPSQPKQLNATIAINSSAPVRTDTTVGIDYQGLTGVAGILLTGGSAGAPILKSSDGKPPLLVADGRSGNNWTQSANRVLNQFDDILVENKQPFRDIVANLATFSEILSRNKDRLENIITGVERMTGGSKKTADKVIYDLVPPKNFPRREGNPSWRLVISEPTVLLALNTDKLQKRPKDGVTMSLGNARWSDNLPNLLQEKIIQSFENAGYPGNVLRPIEGEETDNKMLIDIRGFHLSTKDTPVAEVEFFAKLMDGSGKVIGARLFKSTSPAEKTDGEAAASALGKAFSKSVRELLGWTAGLL